MESGSCDFPGGGFGRSMISPGMLVLVSWADEGICGGELYLGEPPRLLSSIFWLT